LREAGRTLDRIFVLAGTSVTAELERAVFDPAPLERNATRILKRGPKDLRPRAAALLARIAREVRSRPLEGLERVLPFVLGEQGAAAWKQARTENRKQAEDRWREAVEQARKQGKERPAKPEDREIFAVLPAVAGWTLEGDNVLCAVEAGRALIALGRRQQALQVFEAVGRKHAEALAGALALEGGGLVSMQPGRYAKAVDLFSKGIELAKHLADYLNDDPFGEGARARKRLEHWRRIAQQRADLETLGEAYCAYRKAQTLRCVERKPLEAYLAYQQIEAEYPGTVVSSAGQAYCVKCAISLSRPRAAAAARKAVTQAEADYDKAARAAHAARKRGVLTKAEWATIKGMLDAAAGRVARMQAVPLGDKALAAAEKQAEAFLASNEFGLYRCEPLVDLAEYAFEQALDPDEAEARYRRAWQWLEQVEQADAQLASFGLPDKAREVSRPPQKEYGTDAFGNLEPERIDHTAVVCRLTCPFFLNDLRERSALALGFLCFYRGQKREALEWFGRVVELDARVAKLQRRNRPNNVSRMRWGVEHGYLYAYPAELGLFKARQRFAVLAGDFYYCTHRFGKAEALAGRLLGGEMGKLSPKQQDYAQFLQASSAYWRDKKAAFLLYEKVLATREHTLTEDRAAQILGNMVTWVRDAAMIKRGLAYQRELARSSRKNEFVYKAKLEYGWRLLRANKRKRGEALLRSIPEDAKGFYRAAQHYLKRNLAEKESKEG